MREGKLFFSDFFFFFFARECLNLGGSSVKSNVVFTPNDEEPVPQSVLAGF